MVYAETGYGEHVVRISGILDKGCGMLVLYVEMVVCEPVLKLLFPRSPQRPYPVS